jgi:hypothetical protein
LRAKGEKDCGEARESEKRISSPHAYFSGLPVLIILALISYFINKLKIMNLMLVEEVAKYRYEI